MGEMYAATVCYELYSMYKLTFIKHLKTSFTDFTRLLAQCFILVNFKGKQ